MPKTPRLAHRKDPGKLENLPRPYRECRASSDHPQETADGGKKVSHGPIGTAKITASSLVKVNEDGEIVDPGATNRVNPAGFTIHSAVHIGRHDAAWVMHTHTRSGFAVSCLEEGLMPLNQIALQYYGQIGYHDYEGIALDLEERERIVEALGDNIALILRNHGLLTVGATAGQMFSNMFYLNRACEIQESTLAMGRPLRAIDDTIIKRVSEQFSQMAYDDGDVALEWDAQMRLADRLDPGFRD